MGFFHLTEAFPWCRYSKKLKQKILNPRQAGIFNQKESDERGVRLVEASEGVISDGNMIQFFWLVDTDDGTIVDARYQVLGQSALIGAAETAIDLIVGKNYDQVRRLTTDLIDKHVRDKADIQAFPHETYPHLNMVLDAIDKASEKCTDIPLPTSYVAPPVPTHTGDGTVSCYPDFDKLPLKKKLAVIEKVLDEDIRPYIALDAGGVEVINLTDQDEVIISYQGTCTSCYSAVGTTLSYIQQTINQKVHPDLKVVPDIDFDVPYQS